MRTSYKFWFVTRQDDIHISEVAVRFYEGEVITQNEKVDMDIVPVTRYRKIRQLTKAELPHEKDRTHITDKNGKECLIYTDKDFGVTSDLDDVVLFLNGVLKKDKNRLSNDTQKETVKEKLKLQLIK